MFPDELLNLILNGLAPIFSLFGLAHQLMQERFVLPGLCGESRYPRLADMVSQSHLIVLFMVHNNPMHDLDLLCDCQWTSLDLSPCSSRSLFNQISLIVLTLADSRSFRATSSHLFGVLSDFLVILELLLWI